MEALAGPRAGSRQHRGPPRGLHSNSSVGCSALSRPEDPQGQRSSLWQHKLPALRRLGRATSVALRRGAAPGTQRRGASVAAGPGDSGRGSHSEEDRASPSYPSSQGSARPTRNPAWVRSPRGPTPGRRSAPQRRPALGLQETNDRRGSGKRGALPQDELLPDLALQTPVSGLRPQRPSALHL